MVKAQAATISGEPSFHLGYRPALDGIRGVAILLVLLDHGAVFGFGSFGFVGVNTFFVLSGFLITCLLVAEYDKDHRINFGRFYLRRALRLLPALVMMLTVFVIFSFLTDPHGRAVREFYEALSVLFYYENWADIYHFGRHLSLLHMWSLSVEEQFYIIWPCILFFLLSRTNRSSVLCWIALGTFMAVVYRIGMLVGGTTRLGDDVLPVTDNPHRLLFGTDTRADALLIGCLAGVLISSGMLPRGIRFTRWLKFGAMASVPGLIALAFARTMHPVMVCGGWALASVLAVILILHLVSTNDGPVHWLFERRLLVFTGKISYGLYIWHLPIQTAMIQHHLPWQHMFYLVAVVPVTLASYYLVERPCLRWKTRFQRVN